ncbi:MAG: sulfotransferase [Planctomycetota bacterium]
MRFRMATSATPTNAYPFYCPRFWHGMRPMAWWQMLRLGRFQISPSRIPMALIVSLIAPCNTVLAGIQRVFFHRRLRDAELHGPPVFIIGHWRSGTTLLHELLVRDERFSSPSTFQCFAPSHFLLTEWFFRRFAWWLLPGKRPMDNMSAGWDRPQEDEFALVNLGLPSPYRRIAFAVNGPVDSEYLDFNGVSDSDRKVWLATLRQFMLRVSAATTRPLVIKSPTHTGRVGELAREFPNAKFIHLTRDPRTLFPSTCRLWQSLDEIQSLQTVPTSGSSATAYHDQLKDYVIECLRQMYESFHSQRDQLDEHHLIDVRYEDLIANPVATLERIYESLRLSDFDSVRESLTMWVDSEHRDYQPNTHRIDSEQESRLRQSWPEYFERYGYTDESRV